MEFYEGLLLRYYNDLSEALAMAKGNDFQCVCTEVDNALLPVDDTKEVLVDAQIKFQYPPLMLTANEYNNHVIFMYSPMIDCDSPSRKKVIFSERLLKREISLAKHMQSAGYTMIRLDRENNWNLARNIAFNIKGVLLVQIPAYDEDAISAKYRSDVKEGDEIIDSTKDNWHRWNKFRLAADSNPKLRVVLEFSKYQPPSLGSIRRWLGEPVEAIILPVSLFIADRMNYPVLPGEWEMIVGYFLRSHVNVILDLPLDHKKWKLYANCIKTLLLKHQDLHELRAYAEALQIPLQPLANNLDLSTYAIFEKDPIKYKLYQKAVEEALKDRVSEDEKSTKLSVVMVLGAGRGPLVRAVLNASIRTERKVKVYVIEKNPNAIRALEAIRSKLFTKFDVTLIRTDMRDFKPNELADIVVSELLGSFGDNELSPECLDCAVDLLKPDGISIPCNSTSFINPIMSMKLYNAVRELNLRKEELDIKNVFECGYVALQRNVFHIDEPKALFTFVHPNRDPKINNERSLSLEFKATNDCLLHAFAGYFESVLYKDIMISINLCTHTTDMFSWFPIFFPLMAPIQIKKGDIIEVNFHRCVSKIKVWYTWQVAKPIMTAIHNRDGKSYFMSTHI